MSLFRSWRSRRTPKRRPQRRFALKLEALEDRCLLSVASHTPIAQQIASTVAAGQTLPAKNDNVVIDWNATMLEAVWTASSPPTVASRNMAMVQVAVYDAVDAIQHQYAFYPIPGYQPTPPAHASVGAAAAAAADEVLTHLYPSQSALFAAQLQSSLASIPNGSAKTAGVAFGQQVADAVLAWRSNDGSNAPSDYQPAAPGTDPGVYELTPPNFATAVSPQWGGVTTFALTSSTQFMPPGAAPLDSLDYVADYDITKALGGTTSTLRTPTQTQIAHFWSDLSGVSVTPPGHWNEIAEQQSQLAGLNVLQTARVFALLDIGLADAAIVCWGAKYHYNTWRPVTAINYGNIDGNSLTVADSTWTPLWNTPAFPEYDSGHSTFSGTAAAIMTSLFGSHVHFTTGTDNIPGYYRSFTSFDQAAEEAGFSRILGGIHFMTANLDGLQSGQEIGQYVAANFLAPVHGGRNGAAPGLVQRNASEHGHDHVISEAAAWREAWQLAITIVDQSGATMPRWQRWELIAIVAGKLEGPIAALGSLDFVMTR